MNLTLYLVIFFILCLIFKILKFFIKFQRRKNRLLKYVGHLPSPEEEYPIIGSGLRFVGKSAEEMMHEAVKFASETKTPFYAWFAGALVIVVDHPDDVYTVLTSKSCMEKSFVYKFFHKSKALLTAPVEIWKPNRKILNSAFNIKILQSFIPIFCEKVQVLVEKLNGKVGEDYFDVTPMMHTCTLEMICGTTLGVNIEAQNGKNSDFVEAMSKCLAVVTKRTLNLLYHFNFIYKRTSLYKLDCKYLEAAERLPLKVVEEQKVAYFLENSKGKVDDTTEIDENDNETFYETPQIFIRKLLRSYDRGLIGDENIHDHVHMVIFAGNDTTSLTLSYAILLLAMHPDVQDKAFAEIARVCGDLSSNKQVTYEQVLKLDYIEQILRETLRLNPIAPYMLRLCTEDTKIRDCIIPRSTTVVINLYTMHRREDFYGSSVNEFDPDRFHPNEIKKRNPNAFAPFSLGPRNCVGMRYAYIAMKIVLATLLHNYRFTTNLKLSEVRMRYEVTLKNATGNLVRVEKRFKN